MNRFQRRCAAVAMAIAVPVMLAAAPPSHYGAWGLDLSGQDRSVGPGNDFFRYATGDYQDKVTIPPERASYGPQDELVQLTETRLRAVLEAASDADAKRSATERKVGAFYRSFMDEARIEALGAEPIQANLQQIRSAKTHQALAALMGRQNSDFFSAIFSVTVDGDAKNPTRHVVQIGQSGLGLPDPEYYLSDTFKAERAQYQRYIARLLLLAGWPDSEVRAAEILAFETRLASASWSASERRDADKTYNPVEIAQLSRVAPGFAWADFLAAAGLRPDRVIVAEIGAVPKIAAIYAETGMPTLQAWAAARLADNAAPYLAGPFADAFFEMREKTLTGQAEQGPRWKRAIRTVGGGHFFSPNRVDHFGNMGWAVGELYARRYFPPEAKKKMEALVAGLLATFKARTERSDWMSPSTKQQALRKLANFRIKVGYPDRARDYAGLDIRPDDLVGNVRRAAAFDWDGRVARLNAPVDRDAWMLTPQTIDAYASPLNDLVFPAAFLQPPYFDEKADPAVNFGSAVAIIGHELTHGFDDQGRRFDADGALRDWWTPADDRTFKARAAMLGTQFSTYEPLPGLKVNGDLTMGENIADLGGLTLAFDAYHRMLNGAPAPVIDGLTGDQRLFLSWAQVWRGKDREDALRMQVTSNTHAPRQFRVNGIVRNIDAWYDAFDVKPGDALYLPPEKRVRIW